MSQIAVATTSTGTLLSITKNCAVAFHATYYSEESRTVNITGSKLELHRSISSSSDDKMLVDNGNGGRLEDRRHIQVNPLGRHLVIVWW